MGDHESIQISTAKKEEMLGRQEKRRKGEKGRGEGGREGPVEGPGAHPNPTLIGQGLG